MGEPDVDRAAKAALESLSWVLVDHSLADLPDWSYDGHPVWSYTVGQWRNSCHSELLICGLSRADRLYIIRKAVVAMDYGLPKVGTVDRELAHRPVKVVRVHPSWHGTGLLRTASTVYDGEPPEYRQLIWADDAGRFPGDDDFDEAYTERQPDLAVPWHEHGKGVWTALQ